MTNGFVELTDTDSLDHFLAQSNGAPVIIFKHSNSCGISAGAFKEMSKVRQPVGIITVQKTRVLSAEIESRFGVPHESPQVIILSEGRVVWTGSHSQVRAETVEAEIRKSAAGEHSDG